MSRASPTLEMRWPSSQRGGQRGLNGEQGGKQKVVSVSHSFASFPSVERYLWPRSPSLCTSVHDTEIGERAKRIKGNALGYLRPRTTSDRDGLNTQIELRTVQI